MPRVLLTALLLGCTGSEPGSDADPDPVPADPDDPSGQPGGWTPDRGLGRPEAPALRDDVHLYETGPDALVPLHPQLPALSHSADGRLAVDARQRDGLAWLYLVGLEGEPTPLALADPGVRGVLDRHTFDPSELSVLGDDALQHVSICDPDEWANPQPCDADPTHDCYDLALVISVVLDSGDIELRSLSLTAEVAAPKTADAHLVDVTVPAVVVDGPTWPFYAVFEPVTAYDGRLLIFRSGWTRIDVPDGTGTRLQSSDILYALPTPEASATYDPCDARQWEEVAPISHLHHDPLASPYPLAHYPLRDPEGNEIPDYGELGASYPWVDRAVTNLFMTTVRATLFYDADPAEETYDIQSRYPSRCVDGAACVDPVNDIAQDEAGIFGTESLDTTRGVAVAGLWTHGKVVMLDGLLNNVDYGLERHLEGHREIRLYEAGTGALGAAEDGWLRVGTGRDNGPGEVPPPGDNTNNTALISSLEHRMFHLDTARPQTLRDVVWTMNLGKASAEVPFDDWLDPDALVLLDMVPSWTNTGDGGRGAVFLNDGFDRDATTGERGMHLPVRLQNAATSPADRWLVPGWADGYGGVRVEPVSMGGRHGRGLWVSGEGDGASLDVPQQTRSVPDTPWWTSVFVDPRFDDDGVPRELATFADGSGLQLVGRSVLRVVGAGGAVEVDVHLPTPLPHGAWSHLAAQVDGDGSEVVLLLDGYPLAVHALSEPALQPVAGLLHLGDAPGGPVGFRGWLDELKVIGREIGPEVACNHARGTLVEVGASADPVWHDRAAASLPEAHDALAAQLGAPSGTPYVCFADPSVTVSVADNVTALPAGTTSVREALLFPEGPLVFDAPRPESVANPFCQSCHHGDGPPGLDLVALLADPALPLQDDPRRQPSQPPATITGVVPADYAGPGLPAADVVAPPEGLPLDQWTAPP